MSKVYITKASTNLVFKGLKKLQDKTDKGNVLSELESDFLEYNTLPDGGFSKYFNLRELKNLYKMKMILKDLPKLIGEMGDNKNIIATYIKSENNRFTKEVKAPSYHTQRDCEWLNSNFSNIELPSSIKDQELRDRMRHFVNSYTDKSFDQINTLYKSEFDTTENLREINLPNSGVENFDNVQIVTELFQKIQKEFDDMHTILHSGEDNTINKKIKNIVYADTWKIDSICKNSSLSEKDCADIKNILETKKDLTKTLFTFYREKYNKNLTFEGDVLNSIGFRVCRGCDNQKSETAAL